MADVVMDPNYRPLGLESDVSNTNFSGARNPDDALFAQFYLRPWKNNFLSLKESRPVFEDKLFIRIEAPGMRNSIVDTFAREDHKMRFPRQWAIFQQAHGNEQAQVGTPLTQWPFLSASRVEELRHFGFRTVEQVALASDAALKNLGMTAGIDSLQFRERAKRYLEAARDDAVVQQRAEEVKARDAEILALKEAQAASDAKHQKEMDDLRALIAQAASAKPKRKYVRRAKAGAQS